jgi:glycerol-3-phosphate acyltransferase PlsY
MLEKIYWVAGIVVAIAAVIGLFTKFKGGKSTTTNQNARVSGQNNTVNQSAENRSGDN